MGIVGKMLLVLIKFLITAWDVATNWVYSMVTNPEQKVRDHNRVLAKPQETIKENDTEVGGKLFHNYCINICCQVTYIPTLGTKTKLISEFESAENKTMADVWKWSVKR